MSTLTISKSDYQKLISELKNILASGLLKAQKALEYQRLKTYWQIGKQLTQYGDLDKEGAIASENLYRAVSEDLKRDLNIEFTTDTLRRTMQFYRNYPKFPTRTPLTFTHYLALQRVDDVQLRARLEQEAITKNITSTELKSRIRAAKIKSHPRIGSPKSKPLELSRGEPYVYRLRSYKNIKKVQEYRIDCGFKIDVPLTGNVTFKGVNEPSTVQVIKEKDGYRVSKGRKAYDKLYTYLAHVTRVVDGDTIDVHIDVGFKIGLTERLRLKGINAPEVKTTAGQAVKDFLQKYFKKNAVIVVRTTKEGIYGRWLADIFVLEGESDPKQIAKEGIYLNQYLLDQGLVERY